MKRILCFGDSYDVSPRGGRMYAATIRVCPLRERSQAMAAITFWRQQQTQRRTIFRTQILDK